MKKKKMTARQCPALTVHITESAKEVWDVKMTKFADEWKTPKFIILSAMLDSFDPQNEKLKEAIRNYGYGDIEKSLSTIIENVDKLTKKEIDILKRAFSKKE